MKIRFKKLNPDAVAPVQGTPGSAGYDLTALTVSEDPTGLPVIHYGTGIAVEIPKGYAGFIFPRSSCYKFGMDLTNCVGVIDSDYRGEFIVALHNHGTTAQTVTKGERIAQLVIAPYLRADYEVVDELNETERGAGGFGSTGTK